jgi:hypothetical protein
MDTDMNDHDMLIEINTKVTETYDIVKGHSPRIRRLEQFRSFCLGGVGLIMALVGYLKHGGN